MWQDPLLTAAGEAALGPFNDVLAKNIILLLLEALPPQEESMTRISLRSHSLGGAVGWRAGAGWRAGHGALHLPA